MKYTASILSGKSISQQLTDIFQGSIIYTFFLFILQYLIPGEPMNRIGEIGKLCSSCIV